MRRVLCKFYPNIIKAVIFFIPFFVSAAPLDTSSEVFSTIYRIANIMGSILVTASVLVVLYAGFLYVTAGDNEDQVETATKTITYAVIGLVVGFLAFSFPTIISNLLT